MNRLILAAFCFALSTAALAQTPNAPAVHIRGTVQSSDAQSVTVRQGDGQVVVIPLNPDYKVVGVEKTTIDDIQGGSYVGSTTVGERDGNLVAVEVHLFPEAMRGTAEGQFDWDLRPTSKMTNANVAAVTKIDQGRILEVQYQGAKTKILVPETATIVKFTPIEKSAVVAGAHVFVIAQKKPGGELAAMRITVGLGGQIPPM